VNLTRIRDFGALLNARTGRVAWSHKMSEYTGSSDSESRTTPVLVVRNDMFYAFEAAALPGTAR
jgi:outer membrane protein assembly factor BamB